MDSSLRYFTGLFRRFRSFVLRRDVEIVGQCRMCGSCCQDILLRDKGRWLRKEKQFRQLCESAPKHSRFAITGRSDDGFLTFTCSLQGNDNFCTCYEDRLPLCRSYPTKSLYYQGGWIRSDCGYSFKATTFRDVWMRRRRGRIPAFSEVLRREMNQDTEQEIKRKDT